jgi:hypothetical protein
MRGLCYLVLWAVAMIGVDLLLDWQLTLPVAARAALLAVNAAALAAVVYLRWVRKVHRYDEVRLALQVERANPQLKSLLVSFIQLSRGGSGYASPALIAAMEQQAIDITGPLDFRKIVSFKELKRIGISALAVLLVFSATSVQARELFSVLARRMFTGSQVAYPTRTRIVEVTPGNFPVRKGDSITLTVKVAGDMPSRGGIQIRNVSGTWERLAADHEEGSDTYSFHLAELSRDKQYFFRVGDAHTDTYKISVKPPPMIVSQVVTLKMPAYTLENNPGPAERSVDALHFEAPQGTQATWVLKLDCPLKEAYMMLRGSQPVPMTCDADGTTASVSLKFPLGHAGERLRL